MEICRRFRFFDFGAMIRVLKSVDGAAPDGSCQARRKKQPARRMEGIEKENRGIDGSPVQRVKNHLEKGWTEKRSLPGLLVPALPLSVSFLYIAALQAFFGVRQGCFTMKAQIAFEAGNPTNRVWLFHRYDASIGLLLVKTPCVQ